MGSKATPMKKMPSPGDVATVDFQGTTGRKRRPAVIVSSDRYHEERPDLILAVLTSNLRAATASTDYVLRDWKETNLRKPSAFRAYFGMSLPSAVRVIGRLSDRDWREVKRRISAAFA